MSKKATKPSGVAYKWFILTGGEKSTVAQHSTQILEWADVFAPACRDNDPQDLCDMLTWALTVDTFWPEVLTSPEDVIRQLKNPKARLIEKWRGWARANRNKNREDISEELLFSESVRAVEVKRQGELDAAVAALGKCKTGKSVRHIPYFITGGPKHTTCFACHQEAAELRTVIWKNNPLPLRKRQ